MRHHTRLRPRSHSPRELAAALAEYVASLPPDHFVEFLSLECDEIRHGRPKGLRYQVTECVTRLDPKANERE